MTSLERYEFVQKNRKEMPKERLAVALKLSLEMVEYYLYRYIPSTRVKKLPTERKRVFRVLTEQPTDFETNGNFDVDKWAKCLHV